MNKKLLSALFVLSLLAMVLSVLALCLQLFTSDTTAEGVLVDLRSMGLSDFMNGEVTSSAVLSMWRPVDQTTFSDRETVEQLKALLQAGTFQTAPAPTTISDAPGSNAFDYLIFEVDGLRYTFSVQGNLIAISIDEQARYYRSNILDELRNFIEATATNVLE